MELSIHSQEVLLDIQYMPAIHICTYVLKRERERESYLTVCFDHKEEAKT